MFCTDSTAAAAVRQTPITSMAISMMLMIVGCELERKRVECAIMIKAAMAEKKRYKKMKKKQGVLVLILTVVLIGLLAFTTAVGFGPDRNRICRKTSRLGLDLAGGVSITYQAKGDESVCRKIWMIPSTNFRSVWKTTVTEAQVYQEGDDRITVEIPGVTDANTDSGRSW